MTPARRDALRVEDAAKQPLDIETRKYDIINEWRAVSRIDGERNHAFFILGLKLKGLGLLAHEIECILKAEAAIAPHSAKRKNQVASIMNSLITARGREHRKRACRA